MSRRNGLMLLEWIALRRYVHTNTRAHKCTHWSGFCSIRRPITASNCRPSEHIWAALNLTILSSGSICRCLSLYFICSCVFLRVFFFFFFNGCLTSVRTHPSAPMALVSFFSLHHFTHLKLCVASVGVGTHSRMVNFRERSLDMSLKKKKTEQYVSNTFRVIRLIEHVGSWSQAQTWLTFFYNISF